MAEDGELRRGWRVLLSTTLGVGTGLSPLPFYTIGVFVRPLSAAFGWTADQIFAALIVTTLSVMVSGPIVGLLTDRYGVRRVALASTTGFGLCFLLFAFNPGSLPLFYATYALLAVVGSGTLPITWTRAVNSWFRERRGLALGISLLCTGIFGSLAKIYANWLVDSAGWRVAYAGLAAFPLLIALPVAIAFFHEAKETTPERPGIMVEDGLSLRQSLRTRRFWTLALALMLVSFGVIGIIPNLERLITSKGFGPTTAVNLASIIGIAVVVSRPVGGWLIDKFWAPGVGLILLSAPALAFFLMGHVVLTVPILAFCVFLIGFASGVEYDLVAYLVVRYFGMRAYSAIYGCIYVAFALGAGSGPYFIGRAAVQQKTYDGALGLSTVLLLVGACLLLTLGRYPRFGKVEPDSVTGVAPAWSS